MSDFQVDLTNCDREPIHIPGKLQSHGFLIVLNQENIICFFSDNIVQFLPAIARNLTGNTLAYFESFLGRYHQPSLIANLIDTRRNNKAFERTNPVPLDINGQPFYLILSRSGELLLLEFEPAVSSTELDIQAMIGHSIAEILLHRQMQKLLDNTADQVKSIIIYDRVMIYRFDGDGHGEVVAEAKHEELPSWLGLHYPASDIPKQARELYKLNLTRLLADVNAVPAKIMTSAFNMAPLDLTYSQLRAVSPVHIQYLKNMGVASSFSISIIYKDQLWGLIACHNYTPRFIDFKSRECAKLIGQILSSAIEFRQDEEKQRVKDLFRSNAEKLIKQLQESDGIETALTRDTVTLLDILPAEGAILVYNKIIYQLGSTPNEKQLPKLVSWINENIKGQELYTDRLSAIYADAAFFTDTASGLMAIALSRELGDYMVWFRPELIKTINWAGNPEKPVEISADGMMQISPRHSFEVWSQTVSGISESWKDEEIQSVIRLKDEINFAINMKAGAARVLNERMKQAYQELEAFSYTISHDLKSPIASIKSYAQLLIRDQMFVDRGQKMLQRIAQRADQMNLMVHAVLDYSKVGTSGLKFQDIEMDVLLQDITEDLKLLNHSDDLEITIGATPPVRGDRTMIFQVFSNLIGNAVKYSTGASTAKIHIEGMLAEKEVIYSVVDNGTGIAKGDITKVFDLFSRMESVKEIEGSGVGLAIVKRIVEKHNGRIWVESEVGKGSVFFVGIPI